MTDFFHTNISPGVLDRVTRVLQSGRLSEGRLVAEFEAALAARLGLIRPVAVNSGTSALHLALVVAGVGEGDEVILPAQTFVASGLAVMMQRAVPVFADIDPMTGNLTPGSVASRITGRTRAIMCVHWGGYPCDLDEITTLADTHGLAVIEDAAHALGATYRARPIGAISRFTAFSFQAIKHLTTGDGGALCCAEEQDARRAFERRWFGIDRSGSQPSILGERIYDISEVGFKYHMNDLAAAVGLGNLEDFPHRLARRRQIAAAYRAQLGGVPGLQLLRLQDDREHAWWLFTILVERREDFIRMLASHGLPASVVHQRIDRNSVFGGPRADLPGQEEFDARQVSIPVHEGLSDTESAAFVRAIRAGW